MNTYRLAKERERKEVESVKDAFVIYRRNALGFNPSSFALSTDVSSDADAPSVINDELAAVTVPWGLINAGFNLAICSELATRMPLSRLTASSAPKQSREPSYYRVALWALV